MREHASLPLPLPLPLLAQTRRANFKTKGQQRKRGTEEPAAKPAQRAQELRKLEVKKTRRE